MGFNSGFIGVWGLLGFRVDRGLGLIRVLGLEVLGFTEV